MATPTENTQYIDPTEGKKASQNKVDFDEVNSRMGFTTDSDFAKYGDSKLPEVNHGRGKTSLSELEHEGEYEFYNLTNPITQDVGVAGFGDSYYDQYASDPWDYEDLNEVRAREQGIVSKMAGGFGRYVVTTGMGTVGNIVGTVAGVIQGLDAAYNAENGEKWDAFWSNFWNNNVNQFVNSVIDKATEAMPAYQSEYERNLGVLDSILTGNFWANQVANLGWTSSAILSTVLTGGMGAAQGVSALSRMLGASKNTASWLYRLVGGFTGSFSEAATEAIQNYNDSRKDYSQAARNNYELEKRNLDNIVTREYQQAKAAAGIPTDQDNEELFNRIKTRYTSAYNDLESKLQNQLFSIENNALDTGTKTFGLNVAILGLTNTAGVFSNITAPMSNINRMAKGSITNIFRNKGAKVAASKGELWAREALEAVSEGNEEMLQKVASESAKNYYGQYYNPDYTGQLKSYLDVLGETFKNTYTDPEAWKEFVAGFMTGVIGAGGAKNTSKNGKPTIRPEWTGGIWSMFKDVNETYERSKEIYDEANKFYNDPKLQMRARMIIGTLADKDAMIKAMDDNDKKAYLDKEGESLLRTIETFADLGRLGDLSLLTGEEFNMTDDELKEFVMLNSEEIKDENGKGTGRYKSALPVVDANGELLINSAEGLKKVKDRLKKGFDQTRKLINTYSQTLEDVDAETGYSLTRDQLKMLTWMKLKGLLAEDRKNAIAKDKILPNVDFASLKESYITNKKNLEENKTDEVKRLEKLAGNLQTMVDAYEKAGDKLSTEEKNNKSILTSEIKRIKQAVEAMKQSPKQVKNEEENVDNRDNIEKLLDTLAEAQNKGTLDGNLLSALLGTHTHNVTNKNEKGEDETKKLFFADFFKDLAAQSKLYSDNEFKELMSNVNDLMRLSEDMFAYDSMFRKLISAPEKTRDYIDRMVESNDKDRELYFKNKALQDWKKGKATPSGNVEYTDFEEFWNDFKQHYGYDNKDAIKEHLNKTNPDFRKKEASKTFKEQLNFVVDGLIDAFRSTIKEGDVDALEEYQALLKGKQLLDSKFDNVYDLLYTYTDNKAIIQDLNSSEITKDLDANDKVAVAKLINNVVSQFRDHLKLQNEIQQKLENAQSKNTVNPSDNTSPVTATQVKADEVSDIVNTLDSVIKDDSPIQKNLEKIILDGLKELNLLNENESADDAVNRLFSTLIQKASTTDLGKLQPKAKGEKITKEEKEQYNAEQVRLKQESKVLYNVISAINAAYFGRLDKDFTEDGSLPITTALNKLKAGIGLLDVNAITSLKPFTILESVEDYKEYSKQLGCEVEIIEYEPINGFNKPLVFNISLDKDSGNTFKTRKSQTGKVTIVAPKKSSVKTPVTDSKKDELKKQMAAQVKQAEEKAKPEPEKKKVEQKDDEIKGDLTKQAETSKKLEQFIEDSKNRLFYDDATHVYYVYFGSNVEEAKRKFQEGKINKKNAAKNQFKAHSVSASALRYGKEELKQSEELKRSQRIGNSIDFIVRQYFQGVSKEDILKGLNEDSEKKFGHILYEEENGVVLRDNTANVFGALETIKNQIQTAHGKNCKIITDQINLAGWLNADKKDILAGAPDMLVIDEQGVIHIYDMKAKKLDDLISKEHPNDWNGKNDYERYLTQTLAYAKLLQVQGLDVDTENTYLIQFKTKDSPAPSYLGEISKLTVEKESMPYKRTADITQITFDAQQPVLTAAPEGTTQPQQQPQSSVTPTVNSEESEQNKETLKAVAEEQQKGENEIITGNANNSQPINTQYDDVPNTIENAFSQDDFNETQYGFIFPDYLEYNKDTEAKGEFNQSQGEIQVYLRENGAYEYLDSGKVVEDTTVYLRDIPYEEFKKNGKSGRHSRRIRYIGIYVKTSEGKMQIIGVMESDSTSIGGVYRDKTTGEIKVDSARNIRVGIADALIGRDPMLYQGEHSNVGINAGDVAYVKDSNGDKKKISVKAEKQKSKKGETTYKGKTTVFGEEKEFDFVILKNVPEEGNGKRLKVAKVLPGRIQQNADSNNERVFKSVKEITVCGKPFEQAFKQGEAYVGIISDNKNNTVILDHKGNVVNVPLTVPQAFPSGAMIVVFKGGDNLYRCSLVLGNDFKRDTSSKNKFVRKMETILERNNGRDGIIPTIKWLNGYHNGTINIETEFGANVDAMFENIKTDETEGNDDSVSKGLMSLFNYLNKKPESVTFDCDSCVATLVFKVGETKHTYTLDLSDSNGIRESIYGLMENLKLRYSLNKAVFLTDSEKVTEEEKASIVDAFISNAKSNISDFSTRNTRFVLSYESTEDFIVPNEKAKQRKTDSGVVLPIEINGQSFQFEDSDKNPTRKYSLKIEDEDDGKIQELSNDTILSLLHYPVSTVVEEQGKANIVQFLLRAIENNLIAPEVEKYQKYTLSLGGKDIDIYFDTEKKQCITKAEYDKNVQNKAVASVAQIQPQPSNQPKLSHNKEEALQQLRNNISDYLVPIAADEKVVKLGIRPTVVLNIGDFNIPFYCSTGKGGKEKYGIPAGKWYPIFGIDTKTGLFNKTDEKDIKSFYGSDVLKQICDILNDTYGDITQSTDIPQFDIADSADVINQVVNKSMTPTARSKGAYEKIRQNAAKEISHLDNYFNITDVDLTESPKVEEKPVVDPSKNNTQEVQEMQQRLQTRNRGKRLRQSAGSSDRTNKNRLFKSRKGSINTHELLDNIDNSVSSLLKLVISPNSTIFVLSDEQFDAQYGKQVEGAYDKSNGTVVVRESCSNNTIIHELIHKAVPQILQDNEAAQELKEVFGQFKKYLELNPELANYVSNDNISIAYSTSNLYEFLSEIFTNNKLADLLKSIPSDYFVKSGYNNKYEVNPIYRNKNTGDLNDEAVRNKSKLRNLLHNVIKSIVNFFKRKFNNRIPKETLYDLADKAGRDLIKSFESKDTKQSDVNKQLDLNKEKQNTASTIANNVAKVLNNKKEVTVRDVLSTFEGVLSNLDSYSNIFNADSINTVENIIHLANIVKALSQVSPDILDTKVFNGVLNKFYKPVLGNNTVNTLNTNSLLSNNSTNNVIPILKQTISAELSTLLNNKEFKKVIDKIFNDFNNAVSENDLYNVTNTATGLLNSNNFILEALVNPEFIGTIGYFTTNKGSNALSDIINQLRKNIGSEASNKAMKNLSEALSEMKKSSKNVDFIIRMKTKAMEAEKITNYTDKINNLNLDVESTVGVKEALVELNKNGVISEALDKAGKLSGLDSFDNLKDFLSTVLPIINKRDYTEEEIADEAENFNDFKYGYTDLYKYKKIADLLNVLQNAENAVILKEGSSNAVKKFGVISKSSKFANPIKELSEECKF